MGQHTTWGTQDQAKLELLEPRLLLSAADEISDLQISRAIDFNHAGATDDKYTYAISVSGLQLTGLKLATPWGEEFDSSTAGLDDTFDWANDTIKTEDGSTAFAAFTNGDSGMHQIMVFWLNLPSANWDALDTADSQLTVTYATGQWEGSVNFNDLTQPETAPTVVNVADQATAVSAEGTLEWASWADAPMNGQIVVNLEPTDSPQDRMGETLTSDQTSWTPMMPLQSLTEYNANVLFDDTTSLVVNEVNVNVHATASSDITFTTALDELRGVFVERGIDNNAPGEALQYVLSVNVIGVDMANLHVTTPWGATFDSTLVEGLGDVWDGTEYYAEQDGLEIWAGANEMGERQIEVEWNHLTQANWLTLNTGNVAVETTVGEALSWSGNISLAGIAIPTAPVILSPTSSDLNVPLQPEISWNAWSNAPEDAGISYYLFSEDDDMDIFGEQGVDPATTSWMPDSELSIGSRYRWEMEFQNNGKAVVNGARVGMSSWAGADAVFTVADPNLNVVIIGNHQDATAKYTWTDADQDAIAPVLTGPGFAALYFDGDTLQKVELHNTTLSSYLGMKVTKYTGEAGPDDDGDGRVMIGSVATAGGEALGTLDLGMVDLIGDMNGVAVNISGAVKTVKLGSVADALSVSFGGSAKDKFTLLAGNLGEVAMTCASPLTGLSVASWTGGSLIAPAIGAINAKGDFGPDVTAETGDIGNVTVVGGDLNGSLIASVGRIGNITVTAVASWSNDDSLGELFGGSVNSAVISAAAETGKAIGNITLTGGSFYAESVSAAGSMGNFTIKSIRYKSYAEEVAVLNRDGSEKTDSEGNTIYRMVSYYTTQGGESNAVIDCDGKVGTVSVTGGDLGGEIHAALGMGAVTVQGILASKAGTIAGVAYTENSEDLISANLTALLVAEPGSGVVAIPSITVAGGDMAGDLSAYGKVGKVSVTAYAVVMDGTPELIGGNFLSQSFEADSLGNITLIGGSFAGNVEALTIGNLSVTGGDITGTLRPYVSMGSITGKAVTVNASMTKWKEDGMWQYTQTDGMVIGQEISVTVNFVPLQDTTIKPRMGVIKGIGMQTFSVGGQLTFDPARVSVASQRITYVSSLDVDPDTAGVTQKYTTTIGVGLDEIDRSGLTQIV